MKTLVTGSSGLIGQALVAHLRAAGHEVVRLVRQPCGQPDAFRWDPEAGSIDVQAFSGVDGVVHLAGAGIGDRRWSPREKKLILHSRVRGTHLLAETVASLPSRPRALVCASGVGFYGNQGARVVDESSPPGPGFLARVVSRWEGATAPAAAVGIRVVSLRLGVVLSARAGALARMRLPFKLGLGGPIGDGKQYLSWVAVQDVVAAILFVLETDAVQGPVNLTAPNPVTNHEFARALGRALHRPSCFPLPAFVVRLLFGQMGVELLLSSTRAIPQKLEAAGFIFRYPELTTTLEHALAKPSRP